MLPDKLFGALRAAGNLPITAAQHALKHGPFPAAWPKEAREQLEGVTMGLLNAGLAEVKSSLRVTKTNTNKVKWQDTPAASPKRGTQEPTEPAAMHGEQSSASIPAEDATTLVLESEQYHEPDAFTRELTKRYVVAAEPHLPYSMLSEVELYPQWMPFCNGTQVTQWNADRTAKEVDVSFGMKGVLSSISGSIPYSITRVPPNTPDKDGNSQPAQVLAENFGCSYATKLVYDWRFIGRKNEQGQPITEVELRLMFVARHQWHMLMWEQTRNNIVDGMADAFEDRLTILKAAELRKQYSAAEKATGDAFNDMDKNQDGKINREEWVAKYGNDEQFNLFDLDENGCIDMHEFKQGPGWAKSQTADSELPSQHVEAMKPSSVGYSVSDIMQGPFEGAGEAVVVTEADGYTLRHVNEHFENLTGYNKSEVIGRTIQELLQGEGTDKPVTAALGSAVRNYLPASARVVNYRKDGSAFLSYLRFEPILDNEQNTGVIYWAVIRDCSASSEGMEAGLTQQLLSQRKGEHSTWATGWY